MSAHGTGDGRMKLYRLLALAALAVLAFFIYGGNTGRFNSPDISYIERDPTTGVVTSTKGCHASRKRPDGTCDYSFRWSELFGRGK